MVQKLEMWKEKKLFTSWLLKEFELVPLTFFFFKYFPNCLTIKGWFAQKKCKCTPQNQLIRE